MVQIFSKTRQSVKVTFEAIANDWDRLREKPWPILIEFLEKNNCLNLFYNDYMLDLGCGNGRHTLLFADKINHVIGVDFSFKLLKIATTKRNLQEINNVSYVMADSTALPFRKNVFSSIIFLATLHHIPLYENRIKTLGEVKEILNENGSCLITVWRRWQKRFFWHFFKQIFYQIIKFKSFKEFGDIFIPWKKQNNEVISRFYHLFTQREMKKLVQKIKLQIKLLKIYGGPTQRDNIFVVLKKI